MNLSVTNGTPTQRQWVADAIAKCTYPFNNLPVNVEVVFTVLTNCQVPHTYMCTNQLDSSSFRIQIETWADDASNPNNAGLPDVFKNLHEFFMEAFIHEIGHVVHYTTITTDALKQQVAECFVHMPDGRRGTLADYDGSETSLAKWADRIKEAIAEWFRLAFLPETPIYWNRTNWHLSPADFKTAFTLLTAGGGWRYGDPVECSCTVLPVESGSIDLTDPDHLSGGVQPLDYLVEQFPVILNSDDPLPIYSGWHAEFSSLSGVDQEYTPGEWSTVGPFPITIAWGSGGGLEDMPDGSTGIQNMSLYHTPVNLSGPDGVDILRQSQPWNTVNLLSEPGYETPGPDSASQSSHLQTRAIKFSWELPTGHGWGRAEILIDGGYLGNPEPSAWQAPGGSVENGYNDLDARIYGAGEDSASPYWPPPWFDGHVELPISGNGPFGPDNPEPPFNDNGWLGGMNTQRDTFWHSNGLEGILVQYLGASDRVAIFPANPAPAYPDPPRDPVTTGGHDPIGRSTSQSENWHATPIEPINFHQVMNTAPQRVRGEWILAWTGADADADQVGRWNIRVRWFPITQGTGTPPPYPTRMGGQANPGNIGGGSIRSKHERALAGRALQIVDRIGGGTVTKPQG